MPFMCNTYIDEVIFKIFKYFYIRIVNAEKISLQICHLTIKDGITLNSFVLNEFGTIFFIQYFYSF